MKLHRNRSRGQVLIIFVFAIIGLIGITGLAIDGGNIYSDRRHAQNAADTAALAGALVKVREEQDIFEHPGQHVGWGSCADVTTPSTCGAQVLNAAYDRAAENGYANPSSEVDVHIPPLSGPYSDCSNYGFDCNDYVQVTIHSYVDTWFAKVLGVPRLDNRVQAVALAKFSEEHPLYGGAALASLQPTGCRTFYVSGTAKLTMEGGANIFVNSDSTSCPAFEVQHCAELTINPESPVGVVGAGSAPVCTPPNQTTTSTTVPSVQFPPDPIFVTPSVCGDGYQSLDGTWNATDSTYHYQPGHYRSLPPNKNSTLEAGVYCVDTLIKTTGNQATLYGTDVFLWIMPGGYFSFEGGTTQLSAPTSGPYANYLIYVDANPTITPGNGPCKINGNGLSNYTGTIYAPYCSVNLNGTSAVGGWHAQIIGYNFTVNGTTNLLFDHNGTPPTNAPEIDWTGLYH